MMSKYCMQEKVKKNRKTHFDKHSSSSTFQLLYEFNHSNLNYSIEFVTRMIECFSSISVTMSTQV